MADDARGTQAVAELGGVHKRYGKVEALRGIDLEIQPGELLALLGPTERERPLRSASCSASAAPTPGRPGCSAATRPCPRPAAPSGSPSKRAGSPDNLTVREMVDLVRIHYPHPAATPALLERFGLSGVAGRRAGGLSGGQTRRLAVALAFAGQPRLVVLDEPTTGLDVEARRGLWEVLRAFVADGGTVLLTTHYLEEAQALASRVVVIAGGQVIAQGGVEDITGRVGLSRVRLRAPALPELTGVSHVEANNGSYTLYTADPDNLIRALALEGVAFTGLQVERASLEEAFLRLTGGAS